MKLSDYVAKFLEGLGADRLFAISGAGNIRLLDSIHNHPGLDYVCPHHEQAGVMAATSYTRVSGRPGVCLVTAGPGATNTLTGVANAYLDSIPLLILAGQEKAQYMGDNLRGKGVQGLPMVSIMSPVTKYATCITQASSIRYELEKAWDVACSGRPGPVWVEIPQDIQWAEIEEGDLEGFKREQDPQTKITSAFSIDELVSRLASAERPLLWVGHGIRLGKAEELFEEFLYETQIPCLTSWQGSDLMHEDHPLYVGRAGVYGQRAANFALQNCDFLLCLGTRLAIPQRGYVDRELARQAFKVVVDIDGNELEKFDPAPEALIQGDVKMVLTVLLDHENLTTFSNKDWHTQIAKWKDAFPNVLPEHETKVAERINSYVFIRQLSRHLKEGQVIVTDMGTSLTCTHQAICLPKNARLITSTGLGEMGYGLPGAIGAALGSRGPVIFIGTEGSLMMNLQEFQTVVHHQLPIKMFILNNNSYLTIKHTERALFDGRLSGSSPETGVSFPDLVRVASSFGIEARDLSDECKMDSVIEDALSHSGPILINVKMPEDQLLGPKMAVKKRPDGSIYSPPLEDLAPFLPREQLEEHMLIPLLESEDDA